MAAVVGMNFEVSFVPKSEEEALKVGSGLAKMLAQNAGKVQAGGTAKLKIKEAKYIGFAQSSWTDDTYYAIPYEGEMNPVSRANLGALCGPYATRQVAGIDTAAKIVYFREVYMIGD